MSRIRALVVDDEPLARRGLSGYLEREPDVEVVRQCADGVEAVRLVQELEPDLVFLDIRMPEMNGLVIREVGAEAMPPVIFVTAHGDFALQAFDAFAVDYVLKPLDPDRAARAVDRARRFVPSTDGSRASRPSAGEMRQLIDLVTESGGPIRRFAIREDGRVRFVDAGAVTWIEAAGNYALVHSRGGSHRVRTTMGALERQLDRRHFLRIHRSTFVRIDRIRELEPLYQGDYVVVMDDGTRLPSSRSYRNNLRALIDGQL